MRSRTIWCLGAVVLAACGDTGVVEPPDVIGPAALPSFAGTWTAGPSLPHGLDRASAVVHDGKVYLVGGVRGQLGTDEQTSDLVFTTSTDGTGSWTPAPDYPVDGLSIGLISLGDTLFGVGGTAYPHKRWARFFKLLPGASDWERLDIGDEPAGAMRLFPSQVGFVLMNYDDGEHVWRYDHGAGTWSQGAPWPRNLVEFSMVSTGGKLYTAFGTAREVVGGSPGYIDAYDIETDTWTMDVATIPSSRRRASVALLDGRIHAYGGYDGNFLPTDTHQVYDIATNQWYQGPPLPTVRVGMTAFAVESTIWLLGGGSPTISNFPLQDVWIFTPTAN